MTTIAYRDGSLCSDSLVTQNGGRVGTVLKIHKNPRGILLGSAGVAADFKKLVQWANQHFKYEPEFEDSFGAIVVFPNGCVRKVDCCGSLLPVSAKFHALGSGIEYALGAMEMGATAREAVKIGIKYDCYSGGPIRELKI